MKTYVGLYLDRSLRDKFDILAMQHAQSRNGRIQLLMRRDLQSFGLLPSDPLITKEAKEEQLETASTAAEEINRDEELEPMAF